MREDSELADDVRHDNKLWTAPFENWQKSQDPLKRSVVSAVSRERQRARLPHSGSERNHLFLNRQGQQFLDVSGLSGLDSAADGRAFAIWDFDRDGRLDVAVVNSNAPWLNIFRNQSTEVGGSHRFIAVRFVGGNQHRKPSRQFSARDGYGAKVLVEAGPLKLLREHRCGEGLAAQNSATMLLGIGPATVAKRVTVRWPSGKEQTIESVEADQLLTFYEDPAMAPDGQAIMVEPYRKAIDLPGDPVASRAGTATRLAWLAWPLSGATAGQGGPPSSGDVSPAALRMYVTMATWCVACRRELPLLRQLREAFDKNRLVIFGVPVDPNDTPEKLRAFVDENQPPYQLLIGIEAARVEELSGLIEARLHRETLPATLLADSQGRVLHVGAGLPTISDIRRLLDEAADRAAAADR